MVLNRFFGFVIVVLFLTQCKDAFTPDVVDQPAGYLVVEGFINIDGPTEIRLTRTRGLQEVDTIFENGAILTVETEHGDSFPLEFVGNGLYRGTAMALEGGRSRLRIVTVNRTTYVSDFVESKITPEIDSISWEQRGDGVHIFVNTHDVDNQTHYYFWQFEETWHFRSLYQSYYEYLGIRPPDSPRFKIRELDIHNCWMHQRSTGIYLANTMGLSEDRVAGHRLVAIPNASEKLGVKYSMLVKQYALTKEAYHYWDILRKNTEDIGGIFDPQPSTIVGNIRNTANPDEPVVGFVSIAKAQYKRIFISEEELVDWEIEVEAYDDCIFTQIVPSDYERHFRLRGYLPLMVIVERGYVVAVTTTFDYCADCTFRGTNVKPAYWPE